MNTKEKKLEGGYFLIQVLVFGSIAILVIGALISFTNTNMLLGRKSISREEAFQAAEAGIEYYRWHLAHANTDYTDGTGNPPPYVHNFYDKNDNLIGTYELTITPPPVGSTLVKIKSEGRSVSDPSVKRIIISQLAIPSFAKFAFVSNSDMRFGQGTEIFGPIHSNRGIRLDGLAHNLVTSSLSSYDDPDHSGALEFGVHTHVNPPPESGINGTFRALEAPPNSVSVRSDVFMIGRQFPVPAVDFTGITADLSKMKTDAQIAGKYFDPSGAQGYKIVMKTNGTFDLYRVTSLVNPPSKCTNSNSQTGWGTWSVNASTFISNYAYPENGIIFVEDNVWVEGTLNVTRVVIASARFPDNPTTHSSITINNNLLYTDYSGIDVLGLVAQGNINVGMISQDILRIDAALIAQNGRVGRYYYGSNCTSYVRSTITLYGMIGTALRYGFAYTDNTGYINRNIIYDPNLLYAPPPAFPLTSDQYQIISWKEEVN